MPDAGTKIRIEFNTIETDHGTMYQFFPNGVWDEDKLQLHEAEARYPRDKFEWTPEPLIRPVSTAAALRIFSNRVSHEEHEAA